jgi:hypothetical protein
MIVCQQTSVAASYAAKVFTAEDVLSSLDLAGLSTFKDAFSLKLFEFDEIKLPNIAAVISAVSMPGSDALRFKKLLTDPGARETAIREQQQRQHELEERLLREHEIEVAAQRERERQQRELEEAVLRDIEDAASRKRESDESASKVSLARR